MMTVVVVVDGDKSHRPTSRPAAAAAAGRVIAGQLTDRWTG